MCASSGWLLKLRGCLESGCGMEWYGYAALGVSMAVLSFLMDLSVAKLLRGIGDTDWTARPPEWTKWLETNVVLSLHTYSAPVAVHQAAGQQSAAVLLLDSLPSMPLCRRIVVLPQHLSLLHRSVTACTIVSSLIPSICWFSKLPLQFYSKIDNKVCFLFFNTLYFI